MTHKFSHRFSLSKNKIKIVLFEGVHPSAALAFERAGYSEIICLKEALDEKTIPLLNEAHFVGIRSASYLSLKILQEAKRLVGIGCYCIGTNQVDLKQAALMGIPVFNAPYSNTRSVAELVLAEIILLLRQIPEKNKLCHAGIWQKSAQNSFETRGKTLGVIGYGHIGSQLGILAESLGMRVIFYDIEAKLALGNAKAVDLHDLLIQSDAISCHVPENPETYHMINQERINLMKKTAVLINASRGNVVDINALAQALHEKKLIGAAIDVFPKEPGSSEEVFITPLQDCPNVLLTPHIGGSTQEAQLNIGLEVTEKLIKYSDNGSTLSAINFPEVALPSNIGRTRLMHVHDNKPGVMNALNEVFSKRNINILGQYLQTNSEIGYVVIDIDSKDLQGSNNLKNGLEIDLENDLKNALNQVPHTIRSRVLF